LRISKAAGFIGTPSLSRPACRPRLRRW
jgi:hypothetical protein